MASDEQHGRLPTAGFWLIGLSLLVGLWRVWQTERDCQQTLAHQAHLLQQLARFQMEVASCDRLVSALGASQSQAVRVGGAHPATLHQQLRDHLNRAGRDFRALRASLKSILQHTDTPQSLHWAVVRVEAEWQQVYSSLQEYLGRDNPSEINLESLHTFNLQRQDSLYDALESLHQAVARQHREQLRAVSHQRGWSLGFCSFASILLMGWIWYFAIRPAQVMSRWLSQPESLSPFVGEDRGEELLRPLRGTHYEPLMRTLLHQRQRLREVERFVRDLAMGRTPAPLSPQEPNDPLARSSFWLIRRVEEYRRAHNDREAV